MFRQRERGATRTRWRSRHRLVSTQDLCVVLASNHARRTYGLTFLQLLKALECDLKFVRLIEARGVVFDFDTEQ